MNVLESSQNTHVERLNAYQVNGVAHFNCNQGRADDMSVYELLQPVEDASHTRDRKRSPPDSACARGTRVEVVKKYTTWTADNVSSADEPHLLWVHGYAGSGKSAISQEVCDTSKRQRRPVVSFFFFRNAGERSRIRKLATTLASQMAAVIPETEPFIRVAVKANPALLRPDDPAVCLQSRMEQLVYAPFKAAVEQSESVGMPAKGSVEALPWGVVQRPLIMGLTRGPLLVVLDGLDECDDKEEVQELIDGMLAFFDDNPFIPLRVFITSRVEQHIQSHLDVPGVHLENLVDHCSDNDIAALLDVLFKDARRRNPVIRAYISEHGEWPPADDRLQLVRHIGGSFIFGSTVFKFIMGSMVDPGSPATPMERLPLALKMNPGLDGLYMQTLARSQHLPHFSNIISTIALLEAPLPTSGIAELLGIKTYEVVNVLVNLQAIIQVPGTDDIPVTLFHTSLRDFLTTQSRSGPVFAHPRQHVQLFLRCLQCELVHRQRGVGLPTNPIQRRPAAAYALQYSEDHLRRGEHLFESAESDSAIQLCREALELSPGAPELIQSLARATLRHATHGGTLVDLEEAVSLNREALKFRPLSHPDRPQSLRALGDALRERYHRKGRMADLDEAIFLYREELDLQPSHHSDRPQSLNNLGRALWDRYRSAGSSTDIEESISLLREALKFQPSPHPDRSESLTNLGLALCQRYQRTRAATDLEEATSLHREALELRPSPHPDRSSSLNELALSLRHRSECTGAATDLEDAISLYREALELQLSPHPHRSISLHNLAFALKTHYERTGMKTDIEEAISLYREVLELEPSPHSGRSVSLSNLGHALRCRSQRTGTVTDLEEAISLYREALELRPPPHPGRSTSLNDLGTALCERYQRTKIVDDIEEAISVYRGALELQPPPHPSRSTSLNNLGHALWIHYHYTRTLVDLEEAVSLGREALELQPSPYPRHAVFLRNLTVFLSEMCKVRTTLPFIQEAILLCEELLASHYPVGHEYRLETVKRLASLLQRRSNATQPTKDDYAYIAKLREEARQLSASTSTTA